MCMGELQIWNLGILLWKVGMFSGSSLSCIYFDFKFYQVCLSGLCRCGPLICPSVCYSAYWVLPDVWIQWCKGQEGCSSKGRTESFQRQVIKGSLTLCMCEHVLIAAPSYLRAYRLSYKWIRKACSDMTNLTYLFIKGTVLLFFKPEVYLVFRQQSKLIFATIFLKNDE